MFAQIQKGWDRAVALTGRQGRYSNSVFDPRFYKELAKGETQQRNKITGTGTKRSVGFTGTSEPITLLKTPLQFAGATAARLITDLGEDASRRFYWHYNHPNPISDSVSNKFLGKKLAADLKPKQVGGTGRFNPTQRSLIRLAAVGIPVGASLGHLDLTNPGELFRAKGFKQSIQNKVQKIEEKQLKLVQNL